MNGTKKFLSVIIAIAVIGLGAYAVSTNKGADLANNENGTIDTTATASNSYGDDALTATSSASGDAMMMDDGQADTINAATSTINSNDSKKMNTVQMLEKI